MDKTTIKSAGIHFLEFSIAFLSMTKCQYQHGNDVKVNSLSFFTLVALENWREENYTMSDLAEKLQITKQQLSRLINDLEAKELVERIHDTSNRRRVYIRISSHGLKILEDLKKSMLDSTLCALQAYNEEELKELDSCLCRLTKLMEKFNS